MKLAGMNETTSTQWYRIQTCHRKTVRKISLSHLKSKNGIVNQHPKKTLYLCLNYLKSGIVNNHPELFFLSVNYLKSGEFQISHLK